MGGVRGLRYLEVGHFVVQPNTQCLKYWNVYRCRGIKLYELPSLFQVSPKDMDPTKDF